MPEALAKPIPSTLEIETLTKPHKIRAHQMEVSSSTQTMFKATLNTIEFKIIDTTQINLSINIIQTKRAPPRTSPSKATQDLNQDI